MPTAVAKKVERKYLAHFLDASFNGQTTNYVRLGKDLEEYNEELNPDVETQKNILGEQSVVHSGYDVQSEVDPFYAWEGDPLFEQLALVANTRATGSDCMTTKVDVLYNVDGTVEWAYREDCYVIPNSVGGDTSGVQIPFTVYNAGNRTAGTWAKDSTTGAYTFTPTVGLGG